jgi:DUF917 family protein
MPRQAPLVLSLRGAAAASFLIGLRTLEAHLEAPAFAALAVEMGGLKTAVAAVLEALAGILFVDGGTIGRDAIVIMGWPVACVV